MIVASPAEAASRRRMRGERRLGGCVGSTMEKPSQSTNTITGSELPSLRHRSPLRALLLVEVPGRKNPSPLQSFAAKASLKLTQLPQPSCIEHFTNVNTTLAVMSIAPIITFKAGRCEINVGFALSLSPEHFLTMTTAKHQALDGQSRHNSRLRLPVFG